MNTTVEQTGWKRVAKDLSEEEATNYAQIVRRSQIMNERKDAKYIKAENENGKWSVYVTSNFNDLSDDEFRRFNNMGMHLP